MASQANQQAAPTRPTRLRFYGTNGSILFHACEKFDKHTVSPPYGSTATGAHMGSPIYPKVCPNPILPNIIVIQHESLHLEQRGIATRLVIGAVKCFRREDAREYIELIQTWPPVSSRGHHRVCIDRCVRRSGPGICNPGERMRENRAP